MNNDHGKRKSKYESPILVPLGALAKGSGACTTGSSVVPDNVAGCLPGSADNGGGGGCVPGGSIGGSITNAPTCAPFGNETCSTGDSPVLYCSPGQCATATPAAYCSMGTIAGNYCSSGSSPDPAGYCTSGDSGGSCTNGGTANP